MKEEGTIKKRKPIIAVAQIRYFDINTRHNLQKIKEYIRKAKKKNADIICFPESCLVRGTLDLNNRIINEIREECRKNSIWCIITEDMNVRRIFKNKSYNIAILIDREGKIRGKYEKIHLYGDTVSPGKKVRVFKTDFAKIGIVICWDMAFPELFKEMKKAGAEIVFCPAQWWYDAKAHEEEHENREMKILKSLLMARAYENVYFVALCNPVMESKYQISYSAIASPTQVLKEIIKREGLITAKINLSEIKKQHKIREE